MDAGGSLTTSSELDREELGRQLAEARARVAALEVAYASTLVRQRLGTPGRENDGPLRIFVDGAFDLMHFGHMNAFRQARALGDCLVVGVNSSESVAACKGSPPVLTDMERQQAVAACRFVDEIVPASPYIMTAEYIQELVATKQISFFVHGDDPCIVDGKDVYEDAKKAGRYMSVPRTEGISTTDIVGRLLTLTKDHHELPSSPSGSCGEATQDGFASGQSRFLVTSQLIQAFRGTPRPRQGRVVYVDGAWDMFHAGHVAFLRRAHELGDHLLVGVHSDPVVNRFRGSNYPIMAMHERVLSVLGCRFVDDVLMDAPWHITREMLATLQVSVVARGTLQDCVSDGRDPHEVPIELGVHVSLDSEVELTLEEIIARLQVRREEASARFLTKRQNEQERFASKHGLDRV